LTGQAVTTVLAVVDGGATGTRVRLHDRAQAVLAEAVGGPASLTLGVEQTWRNVETAMRDAIRQAGLDDAEHLDLHLAAGLAGARSPANRAAFHAGDPFGCKSITIVTDGYSSLVGALDGRPGIALAVGTGVTGYALRADGSVVETSGWGFPAGDEGGGAWIGWRALQAFTKWWDRRLVGDSTLFRFLPDQIGKSFDDIQTWLLTARSTQFATLAPCVVKAAEQGDELAESILQDAVAELELVIAALDPPDKDPPIALLGGLAQVFAPRFPDRIRARTVPPKGNALAGLLRILSDRMAEEQR
jgi:glucosamine kinase